MHMPHHARELEVQVAGLRGLCPEPAILPVFVISEQPFCPGMIERASFDVRNLCIRFISSLELRVHLFSQSVFGDVST